MATSSDSIDDSVDDNDKFKPDEKEYFCTPCQLDGQKLPAEGFCVNCDEYLCEICYKYHLRPLVSRIHVLLEKSQMPKKDIDVEAADVLDEICEKHKGKIVEFYCKTCDRVGCNICMTINHRTCDIQYIPDYTKENGPGYISTYMEMEDLETVEKRVTEYKWIADLHSKNAHEQVRTYRKEINDTLDILENSMHKKINEKTEGISKELESYSKKLEITKEKVNKYKGYSRINKKFVGIKLVKETFEQYEKDKKEMLKETSKDVKFHFKPNKEIITKESGTLGNITEMTTNQEKAVKLNNIYPFSTVSVKTFFPADISKCIGGLNILKCIILPGGNLLFQARVGYIANTLLTLGNAEDKNGDINQSYQAEITVLCAKYVMFNDMTIVESNMVALTLSEEKKVQFVKIREAELELDKSIDVNGECKGIGCMEDKLFVTFAKEKKVEIMDLNGLVQNTVSVTNEINSLLKDLDFPYTGHVVCDSKRKLTYIASFYDNCILVVNMNGEITSLIPNNPDFYGTWMCGPKALAVGQDGAIYVAVDNPYSIQRISPDYLKRDMLAFKGTTWEILSLAYHENKLYFGNRSGGFYAYELAKD